MEKWKEQQADLMHGHDIIQQALESAGFKVTVVDAGPTTTKEPTEINRPVILGIEGPRQVDLSLTLNVTS